MTLSPEQQKHYLEQLFELLRIPSISTLPEHKVDMGRAVSWLTDFLVDAGFAQDTIESLYGPSCDAENNHPVLYAERIDNPDNPTILIYGHYDVQPVDPIDEWQSPPFEPEVRDGNIYGRGTTDDKGQAFTHLAALHILNQEWGDAWPINVKILLEGEEECGGENIEAVVSDPKNTAKLAADYCFISDTGFVAPGRPAIDCSLRGIAYMQIDVKLSDQDLHSGHFGGSVLNPVHALTDLLYALEDSETGEITIPGIYDDIEPLTDDIKKDIAALPYDESEYRAEAGNAHAVRPEKGFTAVESTVARPSVDVNGIWAGFTGDGAKTIIPATAHAKVSIRTVPNMNPEKIMDLFEEYIHSIAPSEVKVTVQKIHAGHGVSVDKKCAGVQKAAKALEKVFGAEVTYSRHGGSIPVGAIIQQKLGVDPVFIGYGLPDDALHSPKEKFGLEQFYKGIETNIELYRSLGI